MIKKLKGNNTILRLHIIKIYLEDYNLLLKLFSPKHLTHQSKNIDILKDNYRGTRI